MFSGYIQEPRDLRKKEFKGPISVSEYLVSERHSATEGPLQIAFSLFSIQVLRGNFVFVTYCYGYFETDGVSFMFYLFPVLH